MKFLIDLSPNRLSEKIDSPLVMGQLLTPLTGYADAETSLARRCSMGAKLV